MENKKGKITIIAGEKMTFNSNEIFFNSFSEIENISSHIIEKNGQKNGRVYGNYNDIVENKDVVVKESLSYNFYHTWSPMVKKQNT
ncbi:hypothetical protein [Chishuiella sp.]|uniref:hypothetical protein n=1 Tax=Chishuiella sp. TaxID=1969467 RepID=UPI0028AE59DC|nr:hypothetical protein [Chishuiella sp.]